jgi:hypothetical protein
MISLKSLHRAALLGTMALGLLSSVAHAQKSYPTPEDAAAALAAAVKSGPGDILKVLGKAADDIVSSGDEVADAANARRHKANGTLPRSLRMLLARRPDVAPRYSTGEPTIDSSSCKSSHAAGSPRAQETLPNATTNQIRSSSDSKVSKGAKQETLWCRSSGSVRELHINTADLICDRRRVAAV